MSGGQHRDDEANGRADRVNVKRKEVAIKSNQSCIAAQTHECAQKSKNYNETFLTEPTSLECSRQLSRKNASFAPNGAAA